MCKGAFKSFNWQTYSFSFDSLGLECQLDRRTINSYFVSEHSWAQTLFCCIYTKNCPRISTVDHNCCYMVAKKVFGGDN